MVTAGWDNVLRVYKCPLLPPGTAVPGLAAAAAGTAPPHAWIAAPLLLSDWRDGTAITALAVADDRRVVAGDSAGRVRVWNLDTAAADALVTVSSRAAVTAVAVAPPHLVPPGRMRPHLIYAAAGSEVGVWDLASWGDRDAAAAAAGSSGGTPSSGGGHAAATVSRRTLRPVDRLAGHDGVVTALALLPDGRVVTGGADGRICLWAVVENLLVGGSSLSSHSPTTRGGPPPTAGSSSIDFIPLRHVCQQVLCGHTEGITCLAVMDDGQRLVSGSSDALALAWWLPPPLAVAPDGAAPPPSDIRPIVLRGHTGGITAIAPLGGAALATASLDHTIRQWSLPRSSQYATCVHVIMAYRGPVNALMAAEVGTDFVAGGGGGGSGGSGTGRISGGRAAGGGDPRRLPGRVGPGGPAGGAGRGSGGGGGAGGRRGPRAGGGAPGPAPAGAPPAATGAPRPRPRHWQGPQRRRRHTRRSCWQPTAVRCSTRRQPRAPAWKQCRYRGVHCAAAAATAARLGRRCNPWRWWRRWWRAWRWRRWRWRWWRRRACCVAAAARVHRQRRRG